MKGQFNDVLQDHLVCELTNHVEYTEKVIISRQAYPDEGIKIVQGMEAMKANINNIEGGEIMQINAMQQLAKKTDTTNNSGSRPRPSDQSKNTEKDKTSCKLCC